MSIKTGTDHRLSDPAHMLAAYPAGQNSLCPRDLRDSGFKKILNGLSLRFNRDAGPPSCVAVASGSASLTSEVVAVKYVKDAAPYSVNRLGEIRDRSYENQIVHQRQRSKRSLSRGHHSAGIRPTVQKRDAGR